MSERKESVLKNHSTNKNSPCLNTPSIFNGGLEGRRNLSTKENKLYSAIGINQKRFKKKFPEKKNPPKPIERDLFFLEQLESYGVLSTQHIRELIFKGINTRTVLRRLRLLKQRGLIFSSEGLPNGGLAWTLSKKSASLFKHDIETKIINKNTLQHDVAISSIRIHLKRLKIAESWTAEHILKKEVMKSNYEETRNSLCYIDEPLLVPDSLFTTKHEGEMKAVALEPELSLKSKARYKKIFSQYKEKENIWFVWYVVLNRSAGEVLSELWDKYALWGDCQFAYSTLKEIFTSDFQLPEPREAEERKEREW